MAKKRNTLKSDVARLVRFKKSLGQDANFNELYKKYKDKGRTYLDNRSFRFTDDKGKFVSVVNYNDDDVKNILDLAKTKRQEKQAKQDLRQTYQKALIDLYTQKKKKNPKITYREVLDESKDKDLLNFDKKNLIIYNSMQDNLEVLQNENPKLKITITGVDGKTKEFQGNKDFLNAQEFQDKQLSEAWKKVREMMKDQQQKATEPIQDDIDFYQDQLEIINDLREEGLMPVFDDFGEVVKTVKLDEDESDLMIDNIEQNLENLSGDLEIAKQTPTPIKSVPTTVINDLSGKPLAVKINYNDIRGGSI